MFSFLFFRNLSASAEDSGLARGNLFFIPASLTDFVKRTIAPPLFFPALFLSLGICLGHWSRPGLIPVWGGMLLGLTGLTLSIRKPSAVLFMITVFLFAGMLIAIPPHGLNHPQIRSMVPGKGVLQGRVVSLPETLTRGKRQMMRFRLDAESWYDGIAVRKMQGRVQVFLFYPPSLFSYGDRIRLRGTIRKPKTAMNPGEFDYAKFLAEQDIQVIFQGFGDRSAWVVTPGKKTWMQMIQLLRRRLQNRIRALFPFPDSELVSALWLGLARNLPRAVRDLFVFSGTVHLLAISGLHVSMVGGFLYLVLRFLRFPRKWNAVLSMIFVFAYVCLAGFRPPVIRAGIMAAFISGSLLIERDADIWHVLVAAFFLFLTASPRFLFRVSFQLSFLCAAVLILFIRLPQANPDADAEQSSARRALVRTGRWIKASAKTSAVIVIVLLPYFASHFHLSVLAGIAANMAAIPLVLFIIMASAAALIASLFSGAAAGGLVWLTSNAVSLLLLFLKGIAFLPGGVWYLPAPSWLFVLVYLAGLGIVFWHPLLARFRTIGILAVLGLYLFFSLSLLPPAMTFLSAGSSGLLFVKDGGAGNFLIHWGRRLSENRIRWVLRPFLMSQGIRHFRLFSAAGKGAFSEKEKYFLNKRFRFRSFNPDDDSHVTLFRSSHGRRDALLIRTRHLSALILFRLHPAVFKRILKSGTDKIDLLYVPDQYQPPPEELLRLIRRLKPAQIVIGVRHDLPAWTRAFRNLAGARLHFLALDGAVTIGG